jgi:hypothetical protein
MKRYIFLFLLALGGKTIAQKIQVNDSVYLNIQEDKYSKLEKLTEDKDYKVLTYFTGSFTEHPVTVMDSNRVYYRGIAKRYEDNKDSVGHTECGGRYFIIKSGKVSKCLTFLADGQSILVPFIWGYGILLINAHQTVINSTPSMIYTFRYTNRYSVLY